MSLSNPAGSTGAAAVSYVNALLGLLGERPAREVLTEQPGILRQLTAGRSEHELRRPEAPGKWSVVQVVQHQADTELVFGFRLRMVLSHERPALAAYDQDLWAEKLLYAEVALEDALDQFTALRRSNLALLARQPEAALDRVGLHAERGEESARHLANLAAGHDLAHRRQVKRILAGG
jgi:hypothetical protein